MQNPIYNVVHDLRIAIIDDFTRQMKNSQWEFDYTGKSIENETYIFLLRVFILKYIIKNKIRINDSFDGEKLEFDGKSFEEAFKNLSGTIFLFSEEYSKFILPTKELGDLICLKFKDIDIQAEEDDFLSVFYESYNFWSNAVTDNFEPASLTSITQVYTPLWLCRLLVNSTLEKVIGNNGNKLENIEIFDPSCGCGNFLIAAFDCLSEYYERKGFAYHEIPELIIKQNLHGFDIEDRAVQIAKITLFLKGKKYSPQFDYKEFKIYSAAFEIDINAASKTLINDQKFTNNEAIEKMLIEFSNATELGSLISVGPEEFDSLMKISRFATDKKCSIFGSLAGNFSGMAAVLSSKYDIILSNPPFALPYLYNDILKNYIERNFKNGIDFGANLYSCFIKRASDLLKENGSLTMIHPASLFFEVKFLGVKDFLLRNFRFDFVLSTNSRAVFSDDIKFFDVVIYSVAKALPGKRLFFKRVKENGFEKVRQTITEFFNDQKGSGSLPKARSLKKVLFILKHPNLYDRLLIYFLPK